MADFSSFAAAPTNNETHDGTPIDNDDDPTADFLAREQAILGADAALFGNPHAASQAAAAVPLPNTPSPQLNDDFPPVSAFAFQQTAAVPALATSSSPGSSPAAVPEIESEAIRAWRERFNAAVAERDVCSSDKHNLILKQAKDNLERFYAEYNDKKSKAISKNKEAEKSAIAARDDIKSGSIWERTVKQIESSQLTAKEKKLDDKKRDKIAAAAGAGASAGGAAASAANAAAAAAAASIAKARDTARFKQLLFNLRNDKSAPGA